MDPTKNAEICRRCIRHLMNSDLIKSLANKLRNKNLEVKEWILDKTPRKDYDILLDFLQVSTKMSGSGDLKLTETSFGEKLVGHRKKIHSNIRRLMDMILKRKDNQWEGQCDDQFVDAQPSVISESLGDQLD